LDGHVLRSFSLRTHPRLAPPAAQLAVLLLAVLAGLVIGVVLVQADQRSWSGAAGGTAVVRGLEDDGIHADVDGREVVLHLERVPAAGTSLAVEVAPDGRARPSSYKQTWSGALVEGVLLALGLAVVVQVYRWFVTRRPVPSAA
jgi:hypothetical protein